MKERKNLFEQNILVVDDEAVNRELLGSILEASYKIIYANNGEEALEIIEKKGNLISLVLLDILMPGLSGFDVLETMKTKGFLSKIPVIVLTSEKSAEIHSLELGAADFLTKPYDLPEVILARVSHAIQLFENSRLIKATEFDKLTDLYSPDFFMEYALQYDERNPELIMDALVINFTRFHLLNELKGRRFGDKVLIAIADGIRSVILSSGGIACRYDADTFYVYMPHAENYQKLIETINEKLSDLLKTTELRLRVGVYTDTSRSLPIVQRFDRALQACNQLRGKKGGDFIVYSDEMADKEVFAAHLLEDFEAAIQQKQFKVNYQPKFNITGEKPVLCSAEALVRWEHPKLGFVRPDLFIPLFEENGLVTILDQYVWEESAKQIRCWKEELGVTIPVSVNVSRVDINAPETPDFIARIVKENNLLPSEYHLEITESAYTDNHDKIIEVVNKMRQLGHKIEMDDFGSGYSSLNMLTDMPIDVIKMDKAFIRNIQPGNKAMRLVELVLDIAKYLEVPVVAEGVETEDQLKLLKDAGCDIIQGYYFSKPIPPSEMSKFV
jgi:EAL domain-containing protein (putative c-di-GMP-specific phosphodiesterase class I)/CheY-like chemotaxis protein